MAKDFDLKAFEKGVRRCIPSTFNMISGSEDAAQSEELYNAARHFNLPNPKGKEGGLVRLYSFIPSIKILTAY